MSIEQTSHKEISNTWISVDVLIPDIKVLDYNCIEKVGGEEDSVGNVYQI